MPTLTLKEKTTLEAIIKFKEEHEYSPSVRELALAIGVNSTSTVSMLIEKLQKKGYISTNNYKSRTIKVIKNPDGSRKGKLLEVPCLVGDNIYAIDNGEVIELIVFSIYTSLQDILVNATVLSTGKKSTYSFKSDFGKKVFILEEDAYMNLKK